MQRFRRFFALLFILSLFVGVVHELSHAHHHGDVCEVCVLAHTPALLSDTPALVSLEQSYEPFASPQTSRPIASVIANRSRSPPLS
jgi:hypothetical protein